MQTTELGGKFAVETKEGLTMTQHTKVTCLARQWTQLTDNDVTSITFQIGHIQFVDRVGIAVTSDTTPPTLDDAVFEYGSGFGELNVALSDLAPGVSGGARVWAYPFTYDHDVLVSHA